MDRLKSLDEIYIMNRPEKDKRFKEIQAHLQAKYPEKKMTVAKTLQYLLADSFASGELHNVEARKLKVTL
ncbi:hypothetical protein ABEY41_04455 [Peribacillus butanolivorans]|jgi:hypothetical protein|uniref:hypothetical protein n=1 Tax=Peribacillus butanolivorans TaxID=421767 RepID=UPI003D28E1D3